MEDLPYGFRPSKAFEAALPEFDQCNVVRQVVAGQVSCRLRAKYLAALRLVEEAGGAVQRRAEVRAGPGLGRAGVDGHAHLERCGALPTCLGQGLLALQR